MYMCMYILLWIFLGHIPGQEAGFERHKSESGSGCQSSLTRLRVLGAQMRCRKVLLAPLAWGDVSDDLE